MESLPYRTQLSPPPFVTRSHSDAAVRGYLFICRQVATWRDEDHIMVGEATNNGPRYAEYVV